MVLLKPVPGHEGGNAAYFEREAAARIVRRLKDLPGTLAGLLGDEEAMERMRRNARRIYRPGTENVVREIRRTLGLPDRRPGPSPAPAARRTR